MSSLAALLRQLRQACERADWPAAELLLRSMWAIDHAHPLSEFAAGWLARARGRSAEAQAAFAKAFALDPSLAEAGMALAEALNHQGLHYQAAAVIEQVLMRDPMLLPAWRKLVGLLQLSGQGATLEALGRPLLAPDWLRRVPPNRQADWLAWLPSLEAILLLNAFAADGATPATLLPLLKRWQRHLPAGPLRSTFAHSPDPDRLLRIGLISREWGSPQHEQGFSQWFKHHDRDRFGLYAYCDAGRPADASPFAVLRGTSSLDALGFYQQLQADGIDVLVDLSGFFNPARLPALALKPAPLLIQAGANPPFHTGLPGCDGFLTDRVLIPPRDALLEPPLYQASFYHWTPPAKPGPDPGPAMPDGQLRLGALASPNKLSEATIGLWAEVLAALPETSLSLKHQAWSDPQLCDWLRARFAAKGIEARRLIFVDTRAESDYLGFLARVDLLLDSFPYGGALSSCDAAWMGVPVLGLRGGQRIAESFWASLGQPDLLARDREDFVTRARALASPAALAPWRGSLRQRLLASALCDGRRQARDSEAVLRALWIDWAGRQA